MEFKKLFKATLASIVILTGCNDAIDKSDPLLLPHAKGIHKIISNARIGFEFEYDYPDSAEGIIFHYDSLYSKNGYKVLTRFYSDSSFVPRDDHGKSILWFAREWISADRKNVAFLEIKQFQRSTVVSIVSQKYPYFKAPNE